MVNPNSCIRISHACDLILGLYISPLLSGVVVLQRARSVSRSDERRSLETAEGPRDVQIMIPPIKENSLTMNYCECLFFLGLIVALSPSRFISLQLKRFINLWVLQII